MLGLLQCGVPWANLQKLCIAMRLGSPGVRSWRVGFFFNPVMFRLLEMCFGEEKCNCCLATEAVILWVAVLSSWLALPLTVCAGAFVWILMLPFLLLSYAFWCNAHREKLIDGTGDLLAVRSCCVEWPWLLLLPAWGVSKTASWENQCLCSTFSLDFAAC